MKLNDDITVEQQKTPIFKARLNQGKSHVLPLGHRDQITLIYKTKTYHGKLCAEVVENISHWNPALGFR